MTLPKKIRIVKDIGAHKTGDVLTQNFSQVYCFYSSTRGDVPGESLSFIRLALETGYAEDADKRWKPTSGRCYRFINDCGYLSKKKWEGSPQDEARYEFGNCFEENESMSTYRDKIKKLLTERT